MWSETLLSTSYILSDESRIPFYSMSNGYKKIYIFTLYVYTRPTRTQEQQHSTASEEPNQSKYFSMYSPHQSKLY